ncbi:hypothetical protein B0J17DRAFT_663159 [Rhizoctonia solani]|nr:hypothetical protein B0J17DRAFT_663159 [Rhizoctonia solani]
MEYNLSVQHHPRAPSTLQNILQVSKEIECLGRILQLRVRVKYQSVKAIPSLTLHALYTLSLAPTALLNPCPNVLTYMTYIAIVHRLSAYIGPEAVRELIRDFNRTVPSKVAGKGKVRKVPGVGPRVVGKSEDRQGVGLVRTRKSALRLRDREKVVGRLSGVARRDLGMGSREGVVGPMCSMEWLVNSKSSMEQLVDAHPVMPALPDPFVMPDDPGYTLRPMHSWESIGRNETPASSRPQLGLRHVTSPETIRHSPPCPTPFYKLRSTRSQEILASPPTPLSPISLTLPARSQARPYPYPCPSVEASSITDSGIGLPDSPTSATSSKRRSIRGFEYLRNKLGRMSRLYASEASD